MLGLGVPVGMRRGRDGVPRPADGRGIEGPREWRGTLALKWAGLGVVLVSSTGTLFLPGRGVIGFNFEFAEVSDRGGEGGVRAS